MTSATPAPAPKPRRRLAIWFGGGLALLAAMLLLALAALLAAIHTERGSRWLWQFGTLASSGRLAGDYAGGTLAHGLRLRALRYRDGELELALDRFDGRWNLQRTPLKLDIDYLRLGDVRVQLPPPGPPTAPQPPADLELPLAFTLGQLVLERLEVRGRGAPIVIERLRLRAGSDGRHHRLTLETVDTPYGRASAQAELDGRSPFATGGGFDLAGSHGDEKYRIAGHWSGTLEALELALDASGDQLAGQAQVGLAPFAPQPLLRARISADHINPQLFAAGAPAADLALRADLVPEEGTTADAAMTVAGSVSLRNTMPGALDAGRLPLRAADATVRLNAERQELRQIEIRLAGDALLAGTGALQRDAAGSSGEFRLQAQALDLHALHARLQPTRLSGPLTVRLQPDAQQLELALADARYRLRLDAAFDARRIDVRRAELQAGQAQLQLAGTLARDAGMAYAVNGKLRDFDPAQWLQSAPAKGAAAAAGRVPPARINLDFDAAGALAPQLQVKLKFGLRDSSYDRLPLAGGGTLNLAGQRLLPSTLELDIAGNRLNADGSFGAAGDRLRLHLDAPQLQRLGYGLNGLLQLDGDLAGSLQRPQIQARYRAEKLAFGAHRLAAVTGHAELEGALQDLLAGKANAAPSLRLDFDLDARGYRGPDVVLERVSARLAGSDRQHEFSAAADGTLRGQPLALALAAHGGLVQEQGGLRWDGSVDTLQNRSQPQFALQAPLPLSAAPGRLRLGAARLTLADAVLELKELVWEGGQIRSEGRFSALAVARVLQLAHQFGGAEVPLQTDLVLDGDWNLELGERAAGFARIARRSGDVRVDSGRGVGALGLQTLQLRAELRPDALRLALQAHASRIGSVDAHASAGWSREDGLLTLAPQAQLSGQVALRMPELKAVAALAGPELALDGSLTADLALSGTLDKPQWSGELAGDRLALTLFDLGIQLRDGIVRIGLAQDEIDLRQIEFHGGDGTLRAGGRFKLGEADPTVAATIVADRLQLFASPDRRLTISGQAKIAHDERQLRVDGKVTVDRALFDLPKKSAPQLDDDVVVVRRDGKRSAPPQPQPLGAGSRRPAGRWAPLLDIAVDLGRDFRFRGSGADLLLRGGMTIHSEPFQPLRADGTVNVAEGTYEAFGRKLAIERGLINFQGPVDNPNINILAMRRNQEVEAGVEVTGLAQQPRVRLVSEPNVGDEEKLSWLMFGHGSESSGLGQRQAAGAALALLGNAGGKRIAQGIGIDEFSIGSSESGLADQQVVNLGKAISERFYVGYEQSLTGAASIVKVTYQLSRRWSLVARAGAISGLDILFNKRFD